ERTERPNPFQRAGGAMRQAARGMADSTRSLARERTMARDARAAELEAQREAPTGVVSSAPELADAPAPPLPARAPARPRPYRSRPTPAPAEKTESVAAEVLREALQPVPEPDPISESGQRLDGFDLPSVARVTAIFAGCVLAVMFVGIIVLWLFASAFGIVHAFEKFMQG